MSRLWRIPNRLRIGFVIVGIGVVALAAAHWARAASNHSTRMGRGVEEEEKVRAPLTQQGHRFPQVHDHKETGPYIDGSQTPHLIPDDVAYSMFLRMLMPKGSDTAALKRHRSYVSHVIRAANVLSSDQSHSAADHTQPGSDLAQKPVESEIAAVMRFVGSYQGQLQRPEFALKRMKDTLPEVARVVATMPDQLGADLAGKIDRYVKQEFKKQIKIIY